MEQLKELKVVFGDYNSDSFALSNAKISNVNLYKKTNKLELFLQTQEVIPISEIEKFETYAKKRFNFNEVLFKVSYPEEKNDVSDEINEKVKKDWKNILDYISKKAPVIKAFLKQSTIDINENTINIHLKLKGKDILEKQNVDKYISDFIKDIYMVHYKINFIEEDIEKTEIDFLSEKEKIIKKLAKVKKNKKQKKFIKTLIGMEKKKTAISRITITGKIMITISKRKYLVKIVKAKLRKMCQMIQI